MDSELAYNVGVQLEQFGPLNLHGLFVLTKFKYLPPQWMSLDRCHGPQTWIGYDDELKLWPSHGVLYAFCIYLVSFLPNKFIRYDVLFGYFSCCMHFSKDI
jgi:hypothetical protein